jgi:hypothetical protein
MAIVRRLERIVLEKDTRHTEAECTYSIVTDGDGRKCLQIDSYGSKKRKILGKKSQTTRFTPEAIEQLKKIFREENL